MTIKKKPGRKNGCLISLSTLKRMAGWIVTVNILLTLNEVGGVETCLLENALLNDAGVCITCVKLGQNTDSMMMDYWDCFNVGKNRQNGLRYFLLQGAQLPYNREKVNPHSLFDRCQLAVTARTRTNNQICCLENEEKVEKFRIRQGAEKFNGILLKVVTIVRPPFVKLIEGTYQGVIYELLYAIERKYNFSMLVFPPKDGNWGAKVNGSWNGMIGMIIDKEADLGAAAFSVTVERSRVIDFSMAFHQEPSSILLPPPISGEKLTVLIRPLSQQVWVSVFCTIFILVPTLYVLHRASTSIHGDGGPAFKIGDVVWFLVGSILQQGLLSPVERSSRFITAIWWFLTLIVANIYVAFLVSYLSNPKLYNLIDSLESLSRQSKLKWTFRNNTAHRSLFKSDTSTGTYKMIGDRVSVSELVGKDFDGVERVLGGKSAFIKERSYIDYALGNDFMAVKKCRLTLAKEEFFTVGFALATEKRSLYTEVLDYEISIAIATGVMDYWKKRHWPKPNHLLCTDAASYIIATQPKARKLMLDDVQGAYFLWGTGLVFSIWAFLLEQFNGRARLTWHRVRIQWKIGRIWKFLK